MRASYDICIAGTGAFAQAIIEGIIFQSDVSLNIIIFGRSQEKLDELSHKASVINHLSRCKHVIHSCVVNTESVSSIARSLSKCAIKYLVICSSLQTPNEKKTKISKWSDLISLYFALSTPLHTLVAARYISALDKINADTIVVNACFPDAVNPLIASFTHRKVIGVGNIGTIAAFMKGRDLKGNFNPQLLAHHVHLGPRKAPEDVQPRVWLDGHEVTWTNRYLNHMYITSRSEINRLGAYSAAKTLCSLVSGISCNDHLVGVFGLPGGYPVIIREGYAELRLPENISVKDAVQWNIQAGKADGIECIDDGIMSFTENAVSAVRSLNIDFPNEIKLNNLNMVEKTAKNFISLRNEIRAL
ncbi:MAG: hypothetical protein LZT29_04173 [Pantoea stewartii]|uniref:hypothetical protein n=1 Tax=Pantoea stewartii TaxID=66269 RepID=UPI0024BF0166|nr:hypothetical protein [Pantoea stewartii]WHT01054.1 MAG: hypothetical protein LZT29_04173 [Pantoea stewartii]